MLGYFPVLFVTLIIGFEYYAFSWVFLNDYYHSDLALWIFIQLAFHFFLILLLISYFRAVCVSPGRLPKNMNQLFQNYEEIKNKAAMLDKYHSDIKRSRENQRLINNRNSTGYQSINDPSYGDIESIKAATEEKKKSYWYCFKCDQVKIPRSHHCKLCKRCVARMDHHCPWIGNCVGKKNHKYFNLFLFYTVICLSIVLILTAKKGIGAIFNMELGDDVSFLITLICSLISLTFLFSVMFLLFFQVYCGMKNITTIESHDYEARQHPPYDKGSAFENFKEVMGEDTAFWLLPTKPKFKEELDYSFD